MRNAKLVILLAATLMLGACSKASDVKGTSWGDEPEAVSGIGEDSGSSQRGLGENGVREGSEFGGMSLDGQDVAAGTTIFFEYDSTDIKLEYENVLIAHARYLVENPGARVRLEGHTDERGSREYNIGLGERRSQSVRRVLMLQGAQDSQIITVSFGEERPAEFGSSEDAWAKNRRVEIQY